MAYHNRYKLFRVKSVQIFDELFFERGNNQRCHRRNWKRMGCYIFGISYETYLDYLKIDVSDIPPIPSEAVDNMQLLIEKLLAGEKHPVRLKRPGARKPPVGKSGKSGDPGQDAATDN